MQIYVINLNYPCFFMLFNTNKLQIPRNAPLSELLKYLIYFVLSFISITFALYFMERVSKTLVAIDNFFKQNGL